MFEPSDDVFLELPSSDGYLEQAGVADAVAGLPFVRRQAFGWTLAAARREPEILSRARDVASFQYAAVGFVHPEVDRIVAERFGRPGFGVILYAGEADDGDEPELEDLTLPELNDFPLPVVVRRGRYELQSSTGGPCAGQLAAWVTTRNGRHQGWLTARHVASLLGPVVDAASDCTDAAVVHAGPFPGGHVVSSVAVTPNDTVEISLCTRGPSPATVLDVSTDFGMLTSPKFPVRFNMNAAGQPGDSGGYVECVAPALRAPAGIYLGAFTTTNGSRSGVSLSTFQLERMLAMEVYR